MLGLANLILCTTLYESGTALRSGRRRSYTALYGHIQPLRDSYHVMVQGCIGRFEALKPQTNLNQLVQGVSFLREMLKLAYIALPNRSIHSYTQDLVFSLES